MTALKELAEIHWLTLLCLVGLYVCGMVTGWYARGDKR